MERKKGESTGCSICVGTPCKYIKSQKIDLIRAQATKKGFALDDAPHR